MTHKWWILTAVACGTFMATLDSSIVNIALPTLTKTLASDLHQVKWVVMIYLLTLTCFLLPFGRLSDAMGRKQVFQFGFLVFTLGSVFCGLASHLNWLVFFRAVQAIGASMLMVNGPAIISCTFPNWERGAALGILAMVVSVGLISGPSVGGFLIAHAGWRSIFFVNIPVGVLGILLVQHYLRVDVCFPSEKEDRAKEPKMKQSAFSAFDWAGALIQTLILLLVMVVFDPPEVSISGSAPVAVSRMILVAIILVLTFIFIRVERAARAPLFDLSLLKNRVFWVANLAGFLIFVAFSAVFVLMPFFLEGVMKLSPKVTGFYMTAIPVTVFVVAPIAGRLSDRVGSQGLSFAGALIGMLGLFVMGGLFGKGFFQESGSLEIISGLVTVGLALGLFQSPNNNAIIGAVPTPKLGVASALLAMVRNLGLVVGTGLATSLFTWRFHVTHDLVQSFHLTFLIAGGVASVAMFASLIDRGTLMTSSGGHPSHQGHPQAERNLRRISKKAGAKTS